MNAAPVAGIELAVPVEEQVAAVTYDGLVTQLCAWGGPDFSVEQLVDWLRAGFGVEVAGTCRVYWPKQGPWVVADGLSARAALVVSRLLEDERLLRRVDGKVVPAGSAYVSAAPTQSLRAEHPSGVDPLATSTRKRDAFMRVELVRAGVGPRAYHPQQSSLPRSVYVDDVLSAENAVPPWPPGLGPNRSSR